MKQCATCLNYEAENVGRCGSLIVDAPPDEKHYCLAFDEADKEGIPVKYWDDAAKCPYHMTK